MSYTCAPARRRCRVALGCVLLSGLLGAPLRAFAPPQGDWAAERTVFLGTRPSPGLGYVPQIAVVGLGEDRFLLVLAEQQTGGRLVARVLDADGAAVAELVLGPAVYPAERIAAVAVPGGAIVAWAKARYASGTEVVARRVGADGVLGPEVLLSESAEMDHVSPVAAADGHGRVLVAWVTDTRSHFPSGPRDTDVRGRFVGADGRPLGHELGLVTKGAPIQPLLAGLPTGGFAMTWDWGLGGRLLDGAGEPRGDLRTSWPALTSPWSLLAAVDGEPVALVVDPTWAYTCPSSWPCAGAIDAALQPLTLASEPPAPFVELAPAYRLSDFPAAVAHPAGGLFVLTPERGGLWFRWVSGGLDVLTEPQPLDLPLGGPGWSSVAVNGRGDVLAGSVASRRDVDLRTYVVELHTRVFQADSDGDGLADAVDLCPQVPGDAQVDGDGDGIGAACDCDDAEPANLAACLGPGGRFRVAAAWATPAAQGAGHAAIGTASTSLFWFFAPENLELMVKVLDGCALNGSWWVFAAGLTDVATTLTVTDRERGSTVTYTNPQGQAFRSVQDTRAFPCQ